MNNIRMTANFRKQLKKRKEQITDQELFVSEAYRAPLWRLAKVLGQTSSVSLSIFYDETPGSTTALTDGKRITLNTGNAISLSFPSREERAVSHEGLIAHECGHIRIGVMNLIGRCGLDFHAENPFTTADKLLKEGRPELVLVDFHAEATSEKLALGYYLDGRVSALWGTHTHVPTADEQVLPGGTGYITDLGMTGPARSVLGIAPRQSIETFLGGLPGRYQPAEGPCKMEGAVFTLDSGSGKCTAVERIAIG